MEYKNKLSAKEARQVANTTPILLKRIYKEISELANEGIVKLEWEVTDTSKELISLVIQELLKGKYQISFSIRNETNDIEEVDNLINNQKLRGLIIRW